MKRKCDFLALWLLIFLATGCGQRISSHVVRFSGLPAGVSSKTFYFTPSEQQKGSLEFERYAASISSRLVKTGFVRADKSENADYLIAIEYGIDGAREITGQTLLYDRGDSNFAGGKKPRREIVGHAPYDYSMHDRFFKIKLLDNRKSTPDKPVNAYEAKITSTGTSPSFAAVSECIFDSLFKNFFKEGTETISINASRCLK
ncbi:DUF4136 domain-containing protein [bacterium]|nr:MAG: DUF4136 domain-containing protein [bacterium]